MAEKNFEKRLVAFFSEYLEIPEMFMKKDGTLYINAVRACIEFLLELGVFDDEKELKRVALKEKRIIIPDKYFNYKKTKKKGVEKCRL